jgi:FKBP-type peptidyl-prolyl cis-trans isomerase FklB
MQETMAVFQKEMMAKQQEVATKNKKEGEAFLVENKKKQGVKTLPSGLQYKVIKEGTGKKPKLGDTVTAHYWGTLIDGTEFDSSYKRGQPANFPVSGVIPGWTEALQLMGEGAKWQLFIPSNLAYGERGAGAGIGPNATLIFEIELISVQEKKENQKPATKK